MSLLLVITKGYSKPELKNLQYLEKIGARF